MKIYKNKFAGIEFKTCYIDNEKDALKTVAILLSKTGKLAGLDIETAKKEEFLEHPQAGLCPHLSKIRLLQIFDGVETVYVFDVFKINIEVLREALEKGHFCSHNGIFELQFMIHNGFPNLNIGCSMLLSQIVDTAEKSPAEPVLLPGEEEEDDEDKTGLSQYKRKGHSLDAVTQRLFGYKVQKALQVSDWNKPELSVEQITYAGLDAVLTYKCAKVLAAKVSEYNMGKAYKLLKDMQHVVANMQLKGLPVDWEYHKGLIAQWTEKSDEAFKKCTPFFGETNMRSGKQMGEWLKKYLNGDKLELDNWPKTNKGAFAFSRTAITHYSHLPAIAALLEYKKYAKLIDTYGESLIEKKHPVTGNLHTSYTLGQTRTGRLSSRNPNLQNQPHDKYFRKMFAAPANYCIVAGDYIMIELRIQAELSQDPVMLEVFRTGGDIYKTTASSFLGIPVDKITDEQRTIGKIIALSLGFGMGPTKLGIYASNGFGLKKPQSEWDRAHKTYHSLFNVYSKWCDKMRDRAKKLGYIETILGKRRKLEESEIYTAAPNSSVQGSAADLMMTALIIAEDRLKGIADVVGSIHDEILVVSTIKKSEKVKETLTDSMNQSMRNLFPRSVSFEVAKVKIASNWGDAK